MQDNAARVRSFNRTVTQRMGVLQEAYLGHRRSLGASRLLWEIGRGQAHTPDSETDANTTGSDTGAVAAVDLRSLRARLGLDSGYLSRLLRGLEREGLVDVRADVGDQRVRSATLTVAGRAERAELERLSDALAERVLAPLGAAEQEELAGAMAQVERLLTLGMVQVTVEDPGSDAARWCFRSYFEELDRRFAAGFDPRSSIPATADQLREPHGFLLLARVADEPVGAGAVKLHGAGPAELKRMWVSESVRGLGLGRRLLRELEDHARRRGATAVRLETNGALCEALGLYRSAGYVEVAPFNDEAYADHWFEKPL